MVLINPDTNAARAFRVFLCQVLRLEVPLQFRPASALRPVHARGLSCAAQPSKGAHGRLLVFAVSVMSLLARFRPSVASHSSSQQQVWHL